VREIKFRAWDKDGGYYVQDLFGKMHFFTLKDLVLLSASIQLFQGCEKNEIVFEQYTGLADKNGKEIYEGDIVKDNDGQKHQVLFIAGNFCFIVLEKMAHATLNQFIVGGYGDPPHWTSLEIIGSALKDPELIK
jgi:uncharacterized phage protein (TIGR01671 family)